MAATYRIAKHLTEISALAAVTMALAAGAAAAQTAPGGLTGGKTCTVVRSCTFARGVEVRGCLSSFSCRRCDFRQIRARNGRLEWRSTCFWGAGS